MTRKEAIARIKDHKVVHKMNEPRAIYISQALDMAIQALEQESIDEWQNGYDAVCEIINDIRDCISVEGYWAILERLKKLQPVTQKSGKWILLDECANSGYYCSNCQKKLVKEGWSQTVKKIKYCPNCGAKMESEDKE